MKKSGAVFMFNSKNVIMDKVIAESIKDNQDFKILSQIYDDIETGKVPIRIEKYQLTQNIYR